ncbi:MAG: hypothetical protein IT553_03290 [Sphingomonadaceae bacterium]|nr:hypothetical protein [Sphingomonadaceae bacterium]
MVIKYQPAPGDVAIAEMREFAGFSAKTQRYIRRSLDVGLNREDAVKLWSRDIVEAAGIRVQQRVYAGLNEMRTAIPDDSGIDTMGRFMGAMISLSAFDLGQGALDNFGAYRFLYERLLGAMVRPWLPSAFCGAAALPHLHPDRRKALLTSLSESAATAPGWSSREPAFFPEWVEKIDDSRPAN